MARVQGRTILGGRPSGRYSLNPFGSRSDPSQVDGSAVEAQGREIVLWTQRGAPRDYDVDHYARVLRDTYAARLARAFTPGDFAAVFAEPDQLSLFAPPTSAMRPVLHRLPLPDGGGMQAG
jgi:hypothetical protein